MFSISALDSISLEFAVTVWRGRQRSVEHAALVGGDHVLNVNECIISAVCLEHLECLHDEVTKVATLALTVVDLVTLVQVLRLEQVHDGEDLAVVGHQGFSDGVAARDELLQDVQSRGDDFRVTCVQCRCISQKHVGLNLSTHAARTLFAHALTTFACAWLKQDLKMVTYS